MKVKKILAICLVILTGCHPSKNTDKNTTDSVLVKQTASKKDTSVDKGLKLQIYGKWCPAKDTVSIFSIDKKEIYYYSDLSFRKYSLSKDTITIKYDDYDYKGIVSVAGNKLIMQGLEKFKGNIDTLYKCSH